MKKICAGCGQIKECEKDGLCSINCRKKFDKIKKLIQ